MPRVIVEARLGGADPAVVFEALGDFARFAEHTAAVREVRVGRENGALTSDWSVTFREGELRWRERDTIDAERRSIAFEQVDGDFERLSGSWHVADADGGVVVVTFDAEFDLGMPSLEAIIDPIASDSLQESVRAILRGVLGARATFS